MTTLLELDERRRATFGRIGGGTRRYLVDELPDGRIMLTPAVVVSEAQAALDANPQLAAAIDQAANHPDDWLSDDEFWAGLGKPELSRRSRGKVA